ncbi:MAG: hypothetical protein ACOC41_01375 [Chitinivibrionales bacterium]
MIDCIFSLPFLAVVGVATITVIAVIALRITLKYTAFILFMICTILFGLIKWGVIDAEKVEDLREKLHLETRERIDRTLHKRQ